MKLNTAIALVGLAVVPPSACPWLPPLHPEDPKVTINLERCATHEARCRHEKQGSCLAETKRVLFDVVGTANINLRNVSGLDLDAMSGELSC